MAVARYSLPEMSAIWSDESKFQRMLEVELLVCEAQEQIGIVPKSTAEQIRKQASFSVERIQEIERETGHDVIAFIMNVSENIDKEIGRYLHFGVTSSDILDTCLSLQIRDAAALIVAELSAVLDTLRTRALETRDWVCIGRTHGMHADVLTFGLKLARFYAEFQRGLLRFQAAAQGMGVCAISGAVGTYEMTPPAVEEYVAKQLRLVPELVSSQVIPRDRHAHFFSACALLASSIENIAIEMRHLQRTEVGEAEEPFSSRQMGSSAMPHKKNPVMLENITGIARLIRSAVVPALENVALWHERDISHSSVERAIAPDVTTLLHFALRRLNRIISGMTLNREAMLRNAKLSGGSFHSQTLLLHLVEHGHGREEAYRIVQRVTFEAKKAGISIAEVAKRTQELQNILTADLMEKISGDIAIPKHIDYIFKRVFTDSAEK